MSVPKDVIEELTASAAEHGVDLRPGLASVEEQICGTVQTDNEFLNETGRHLIDAGGKRFRPMLSLLWGMVGGETTSSPAVISAGVIVELVHLSTLYHDDVIDTADTRRGVPAGHVKWSNTVAILTGDFLLARASELSASLGVEVTRTMARTIGELCDGQIREVQGSFAALQHGTTRITPDYDHYMKVLDGKTASLIRASCRLGAFLGGLPAPVVEAAATYGNHLGLAFQLADDVLDIASPTEVSGKVPGTDLREGVYTLPVLLAMKDDPEGRLASLLADPTEPNVAEALELLRNGPALDQARDAAFEQAELAIAALEPARSLPTVLEPAVEGLTYLSKYAVERLQ